MAYAAQHQHSEFRAVGATVADTIRAFGRRIMESGIGHQRLAQVDRLNALSDADLARAGLKRSDIPAVVFRDLMYY